jgi:hypothetical protein
MQVKTVPGGGLWTLEEMREFAWLDPASQRYIRRSLDVALQRGDAVERWSRNAQETTAINSQREFYNFLQPIRIAMRASQDVQGIPRFFGALVTVLARDLAEGRLAGFAAYQFLYERLLGGSARPWLPSSFLAAAVVPAIPPPLRQRLLQSMVEGSALATMWPAGEPHFFPEWVDKD